ncbi:hypothetical protein MINS_27280 [Mycolicibacterium insubricum]|jgi:hypothetical protein|nr:hypothetical protein MINS_27280 [Mycolicibacterium insubricum]
MVHHSPKPGAVTPRVCDKTVIVVATLSRAMERMWDAVSYRGSTIPCMSVTRQK